MGIIDCILIGQYGALKLTFSLLKRVLFLVLSSFSPLSSNSKFPSIFPTLLSFSFFFFFFFVFLLGHYRYAYPPAMQAERKQYGALVYFYRCQLIEGGVSLETRLYKDFAWVSSSELGEYLDKDFAEYMTHVLPR